MPLDPQYVKILDFLKKHKCIDDWVYGFCSVLDEGTDALRNYMEEHPLPDDPILRKNRTVVAGATEMFALRTYHKADDLTEKDLTLFKIFCTVSLYQYEVDAGEVDPSEPTITVKLRLPKKEDEE